MKRSVFVFTQYNTLLANSVITDSATTEPAITEWLYLRLPRILLMFFLHLHKNLINYRQYYNKLEDTIHE
jgi:hypothetical protein